MSALPVPAHEDRGSGPTALFLLHGIGGGRRAWPAQLDGFAARGHRVVAWDQPGYGDSPIIDPYDWAGVTDALVRLIRHVGAARNVIVGHSMGGMVAQELVARHPALVHALVLSGTSPAFGKPDGDWQRTFVASRLAPLEAGRTMRDLAGTLVPGMLGDAPDPAGSALAIETMAAVPPATYRRALHMLVTFDRRAALERIAVPTLVLAGERDTNAAPAVMQKMAERIPGAEYVMVPGMGHLACMERPATFNRIVLDFVDAHPH